MSTINSIAPFSDTTRVMFTPGVKENDHLKTRVICVDLDGTLSDDTGRAFLRPALGSPLSSWANFHQACGQDTPLAGVITLVQALAADFQIHIISGRWEITRHTTEAWLARHHVAYDALRLYALSDIPTKNYIHKVRYVEQLRSQGLTPVLFIENEPLVAQYIQENGKLPVLHVPSRHYITTDAPQLVSNMPDAYQAYSKRPSEAR